MDYFPDGDLSMTGLLYDVQQMVPNNNGAYQFAPSMEDSGITSLPTSPCIGACFLKTKSGTVRGYAGSASKIYELQSGSWTDRSNGVTFTATSWEVVPFGDNSIAANGSSKLQVASGGVFSDITDSPAGASIVFVHKNALVALGPNDQWKRSNTADYATWIAAANNDAGGGNLYGGVGGAITAGCSFGNLAIAWKKNAIYGGIYVGSADPSMPSIKWDLISDNPSHGCCAQWAWEKTEAGLIYVSPSDILLFDGSRPRSIADKIRKTWLAEAYTNNSKIWVSHDRVNNTVYVWTRPSGQSSNTRAWAYNYRRDQWGRVATVDDISGKGFLGFKLPVRNAIYEDATSAGVTTNSKNICNLLYDSVTNRFANQSGQTFGQDGVLRTGMKGRPDTESVLSRIYVVPDAITSTALVAPYIPYADVSSFSAGKNLSNTKRSYLANGSWIDVSQQGYWFQSILTIAAAGGGAASQFSIQKLLHEMQPVPRSKNYTLTE